MTSAILPEATNENFQDRRDYTAQAGAPGSERRQFTNTYDELSPDARELAQAIDAYKLMHRRRFITYEEMLGVVKGLGYGRVEAASTQA